MIQWTDQVIEAAVRDARGTYPFESCGIIWTRDGEELLYRRCKNMAKNRQKSFKIAPEEIVYCEQAGEIVCIVHSHPNGTADISDLDKRFADSNHYPWLILSEPYKDLFFYKPPKYKVPELLGREFFYGINDCCTFVNDFYRKEYNIILPDCPRKVGWDDSPIMTLFEQSNFKKTKTFPEPGDLLLMNIIKEEPDHLAVYIGNQMLAHHLNGKLSRMERYCSFWIQKVKIIGRWQSNDSK